MNDNGYKYLAIKRGEEAIFKIEEQLSSLSSEEALRAKAIQAQIIEQTQIIVNGIMLN